MFFIIFTHSTRLKRFSSFKVIAIPFNLNKHHKNISPVVRKLRMWHGYTLRGFSGTTTHQKLSHRTIVCWIYWLRIRRGMVMTPTLYSKGRRFVPHRRRFFTPTVILLSFNKPEAVLWTIAKYYYYYGLFRLGLTSKYFNRFCKY